MTRFDLFLELQYNINHLLEGGFTTSNIHEAHQMMEYSFDRFEEFDGIPFSELGTILDGIAMKLLEIPKELKEYFQVLQNFKSANEIYLCDLPSQFRKQTIEQVQFMIELFNILDDLLEIGMTSCNLNEARIKIEALFQELQPEENHTPNALDYLFPNLQTELNSITIFTKSEGDNDDII